MTDESIRAAFLQQADLCRAVGSPFTAGVLTALSKTLDDSTQTGRVILGWAGDPLVDALPLRVTGGLHALARSGEDPGLATLYRDQGDALEVELRRVLSRWDMTLLPWLDSAPQTNEVGRSGMLWPGVMEISRRFGPRVELLELGASAGLNLNMDHYSYDLGGVIGGDRHSAIRLRPKWNGAPPAFSDVDVVRRRGVDLNPLDVSDSKIAARLLAYVWPDQSERLARIAAAIDLAQLHPPSVERGDGADWIEARLAEPQEEGATRIIFHSIALQYFPADGRRRVVEAIKRAGDRATMQRPLAWLSMEFTAEVKAKAQLRLQTWPGQGALETLAQVHPHGAEIDWAGPLTPPARGP